MKPENCEEPNDWRAKAWGMATSEATHMHLGSRLYIAGWQQARLGVPLLARLLNCHPKTVYRIMTGETHYSQHNEAMNHLIYGLRELVRENILPCVDCHEHMRCTDENYEFIKAALKPIRERFVSNNQGLEDLVTHHFDKFLNGEQGEDCELPFG